MLAIHTWVCAINSARPDKCRWWAECKALAQGLICLSFLTSSGQFGFVRRGFLLAVPFNFSWTQISALCLGLHSPTAPKQCHCPVYISTLFFSFISITMGCEQGQVCSTTAEYSCLLSLQNFKVRKKPSKTQTTKKTTNSFRREITQKAFSPLILLLGISPIGVAYSSAHYREKGKRHAIHWGKNKPTHQKAAKPMWPGEHK